MKPKIFIDGSEGTTGLQIYDRLCGRDDIELLNIERSKRKDMSERKRLINSADLIFLCLPEDAAREAVTLIESGNTRVIDASTAHRVASGWVYGLPELSKAQRESIKTGKRISNTGCHAAGAIMLLAPLVRAKLIPHDYLFSITSVTGYTGGGKAMISAYEDFTERDMMSEFVAPRLYSTTKQHKHIPEIMKYTRLTTTPAFLPIVADYPQGMQVIIPFSAPGKRREILSTLSEHYENCMNIEVTDESQTFAPSNMNACTDKTTLRVSGFDDMIILTAQFDNLGKGASGAAVQNMNIMLGFGEYEGLQLGNRE